MGLMFVSLLFLFFNLGFEPLYDWDEAWYAQVALELKDSSNWTNLSWQNKAFYDKPPLVFWLMAFSMQLAGNSEAVIRFTSACCGLGCIGFTVLIAFQLFKNHQIACWSGLILLLSPPFLQNARMAMLDTSVSLGLLSGAFGALKARKNPSYTLLIGLGFGWALMSKGVIGFLLILILIPFWLWEKETQLWRNPWLYAGLLIGLIPLIYWYSLQSQEFWKVHWGFHVMARATQVLDGHGGGFFFYITYLLSAWQPWCILVIPAIPFLRKHMHLPSTRFIVCWVFIPLLTFSLAQTKLPWYILPIYPGLAIGLAWFLTEAQKNKWYSVWLGGWFITLGLLLATTGIAFTFQLQSDPAAIYGSSALVLGSGLVISGIMYLKKQLQWLNIFAASTGLTLFIMLFIGLNWNSATGAPNPKVIKHFITTHVPAKDKVLTLNYYSHPAFYFYTQHTNQSIDKTTLIQQWDQLDKPWLLIFEKDWTTEIRALKEIKYVDKQAPFILLTKH